MKIGLLKNFLFVLCVISSLLLLSGCGAGKFFIERAVNGMQEDIASELKDYARFNADQQRQIDGIAQRIAIWVKTDRLRALERHLQLLATDIQGTGKISAETWTRSMELIENPMRLSTVPGVVESIANLVYGLSAEQAGDVVKKLQKYHLKATKEQSEVTPASQNKKLLRALKMVFSELDIDRTKAQLNQARDMLEQRRSHIDEKWQEAQNNHAVFIELVSNRALPEQRFAQQFLQAWKKAERGAKYLAPEKWQHNAQVAYGVLNYLLADLSALERSIAAQNIRDYALLFNRLAAG